MKLEQLLERLEYTCVQGSLDREISGIANDSRQVVPGTLFFSIRGAVTDGHTYAAEVAEKGAVALLVEEPVEVPESVTVIQVKDTRYAMALVSAAWYDYPAEKLKVIGITGTKGKTTTTYMIKSILESAGHNKNTYASSCVPFSPFTSRKRILEYFKARKRPRLE